MKRTIDATGHSAGVVTVARVCREIDVTREVPDGERVAAQPVIREDQTGQLGMADGFAVPVRPSNVGGGKGPEFKANAASGEGRRRLGQ